MEFMFDSQYERWFLYLHYMDVHQYVYESKSALFGVSYSDIYDNAIHWTDTNIARLVERLNELDQLDDTLIIVASDHGEEFNEHGREGHARSLYAEVTHTPLILSLPFRLVPGVVIEAPTENIDLWPTVFDLIGLPQDPNVHGRSLLPQIISQLEGKPHPAGDATTHAYLDQAWGRVDVDSHPIASVRKGPWRLIRPHQKRPELYDLSSDPGEQRDQAAERPLLVQAMLKELDRIEALPPAPWGEADEVTLDSMKLGQLRALGYVIE
jgi:arylsulfatase A-like enzyme